MTDTIQEVDEMIHTSLHNPNSISIEELDDKYIKLIKDLLNLPKREQKLIMRQINTDAVKNTVDLDTIENTNEKLKMLYQALKSNDADLTENQQDLYPSNRSMI